MQVRVLPYEQRRKPRNDLSRIREGTANRRQRRASKEARTVSVCDITLGRFPPSLSFLHLRTFRECRRHGGGRRRSEATFTLSETADGYRLTSAVRARTGQTHRRERKIQVRQSHLVKYGRVAATPRHSVGKSPSSSVLGHSFNGRTQHCRCCHGSSTLPCPAKTVCCRAQSLSSIGQDTTFSWSLVVFDSPKGRHSTVGAFVIFIFKHNGAGNYSWLE